MCECSIQERSAKSWVLVVIASCRLLCVRGFSPCTLDELRMTFILFGPRISQLRVEDRVSGRESTPNFHSNCQQSQRRKGLTMLHASSIE
eukprot:4496427-Amphidinium_carterae.1